MRKISTFLPVILAVLMILIFSSCKARTINTSDKVNVIATIFPEYDWAREIIGETDNRTTLTLLVKNGVDLHSYQPSAADIVKISTCDLFIYVGGESDKWVKDALANATNKNMKVINLMEVLKDSVKEEEIVEGMQTEDEEDADGGHDHSDEAARDLAEHDLAATAAATAPHSASPEYDEHVWLSIRNAQTICKEIAESLCALVPENAELYQKNLAAYSEQLQSLDLTYKSVIASAKHKTFIVCDRFPFRYLADDYGLKYYAAFAGCSAETEASFETMAFLANKLKEEQLPAVFILDRSSDKIAKTVILNAKMPHTDTLTLDSMQSTSLREAFNGKTYINTMQKNLENLQKGLE